MPELDLLRYRPDLRPPKIERTTKDLLTTTPDEPETEFVGIPPGAVGYLQNLPEESIFNTMKQIAEESKRLFRSLATQAPVLAGMTPELYMQASEEEAIRYEAEAIATGDSLTAMLLPVAKELSEAAEEALAAAEALKDQMPDELPAFLDTLATELKKGEYASAAIKITSLALVQAFAKLGKELSDVMGAVREAGKTAPIDALGAAPATTLRRLGTDRQLRERFSDIAERQGQEAIVECSNALRRRKRVPVVSTMRNLRQALPALIKRKAEITKLVQDYDLSSPELAGIATVLLGGSGNILQLLQSGIGDISRIGALMHLEWREYMEAGRNRYLLKQTSTITSRASQIGTQETETWLSRQGDLTWRPAL